MVLFNKQNNIVYPFQNLSLGFILKIFLNFRKFQPRYSYEIYSYKKNKVSTYGVVDLFLSLINSSRNAPFRTGQTH